MRRSAVRYRIIAVLFAMTLPAVASSQATRFHHHPPHVRAADQWRATDRQLHPGTPDPALRAQPEKD
jgi:hypothetical protein